jgi:hypothetical protein
MSGLRLMASLALAGAGAWAGEAAVLPDKGNPDYLYSEDFESGREQTGALPPFSITGRHGVRAGAGWKSGFGYSNVLVENNGLPPYPEVRFPRHDGVLFAHYMVQVPANYYIGRGDHGYYLFDSAKGKGGKDGGMAVVDHATDHRPWLDPEWDPNGFSVLRGSGYHRILRSFEGHEPGRRGQWHEGVGRWRAVELLQARHHLLVRHLLDQQLLALAGVRTQGHRLQRLRVVHRPAASGLRDPARQPDHLEAVRRVRAEPGADRAPPPDRAQVRWADHALR